MWPLPYGRNALWYSAANNNFTRMNFSDVRVLEVSLILIKDIDLIMRCSQPVEIQSVGGLSP